MGGSNLGADYIGALPKLRQQPIDFFLHQRELSNYTLCFVNMPLKVVAFRETSSFYFGRQVARAGGARLADAEGLCVGFENLQELLAFLPRHPFILS